MGCLPAGASGLVRWAARLMGCLSDGSLARRSAGRSARRSARRSACRSACLPACACACVRACVRVRLRACACLRAPACTCACACDRLYAHVGYYLSLLCFTWNIYIIPYNCLYNCIWFWFKIFFVWNFSGFSIIVFSIIVLCCLCRFFRFFTVKIFMVLCYFLL